jgi:hypothetical protein
MKKILFIISLLTNLCLHGQTNDDTLPRLKIKSKEHSLIIKSGSQVDFKLKTKEKIKGKVISYNSTSLTVLNATNQEIKITSTDIIGIKKCSYIILPNHEFALLTFNCHYSKMTSVTFATVYRKYNAPTMRWMWVEH